MKFKNRVNIVRNFSSKQTKTNSFPTECALELSRKCNLRCIMHPHWNLTRSAGFMQPDVFEKVVSKISPYAEMVYLSGAGEPLLNVHLLDYISELRERKIPVGTSTNCTLLTPEMSEKILLNDISYIILPLDGITKETYESIRVNADFDLVLRNIKQFLFLKKRLKKRTFVQLQMVSMEENKEDVKKFPDFVRKIDIYNQVSDIRIKPVIDYTGKTRSKFSDISKAHKRACFLLWRNLFVSHDGIAFACSQDSDGAVPIGDFRTETLEEIWNSKAMQSFRNIHVQGKICESPICTVCDLAQEYFSLFTVISTLFFDAFTLKKYISYYEKYILRQH